MPTASPPIIEGSFASLSSLPTELHHQIIAYLPAGFIDRQHLRSTCHHFFTIIPPLAIEDVRDSMPLWAKTTDPQLLDLVFCSGCKRLRQSFRFEEKNPFASSQSGEQLKKFIFFCLDCGCRPLVDDEEQDQFKYKLGDYWFHAGKWWVRCVKCEEGKELCEQGVATKNTDRMRKLCVGCYAKAMAREAQIRSRKGVRGRVKR